MVDRDHRTFAISRENAKVGMDAEFVVTSWNDEAAVLLGWIADEVIGRSAFKVIPGSGNRQERLRALREQGAWRGPCTLSGKRDRRVRVEADIVSIRDRVGGILGYHSTIMPVFDGRKLPQIAVLRSQAVGRVPARGNGRDTATGRESRVVGVIQSIDRRRLVGANIRRARNAKGLTQLALARAIRVGRPRVADYEAGAHEPSWSRLVEIARTTEVPGPGWFYNEHDELE